MFLNYFPEVYTTSHSHRSCANSEQHIAFMWSAALLNKLSVPSASEPSEPLCCGTQHGCPCAVRAGWGMSGDSPHCLL